jgi:tRNA threonylcarbamoyladenosine biosynthesis protein TsaE
MQRWTTELPDEARTDALGAALAVTLTPGLTVALHGELGAGKTHLTRALLQSAGHAGRVKSPTYTLVEPYVICLQGQSLMVMHFDLYRLGSAEEFIDAGFREYFDGSHICIVEWPERAKGVLPIADLEIFLSVKEDGRAVELCANSEQGATCLNHLDLHWTW